MMPTTTVTLVECDGTEYESCGFVASTAATLSDDGSVLVSKVTAVFHEVLPTDARTILVEGVEYTVLAIRKAIGACITKIDAFRTVLTGCDVCDGLLFSGIIVSDCSEDAFEMEPGAEPLRFSARHLRSETRKLGDILTHIETYELTVEGNPVLTADNVIEGCGRAYKVREVVGRNGIREPMRVLAEVTTRPRARI
jgi:hypothetical protein